MSSIEKLQMELNNGKGVRVGQAAVVSRKVHTINYDTPQNVNIIINADAGQAFYYRFVENEIIHVDLFHEIKIFNLMQMADFLKKSLVENSLDYLIDNIDIQTGSGGGRLTGSLSYGITENLKKNHLNHVHITAFMTNEELENIFLIVAETEKALQEQGVELRKIERIKHETGNTPIDMSPYTTDSDSYLKQNGGCSKKDSLFSETTAMIEYFGSLKEVEDAIKNFEFESDISGRALHITEKNDDFNDIIKYFEQTNILSKHQNKYRLTSKGKELKEFLRIYKRELEFVLKRTIKNPQRINNYKGFAINHLSSRETGYRSGPSICKPYVSEEWPEELDISETVRKSLVRSYIENKKFSIEQEDIVAIKRTPKLQQDICLIIDASASMAGFRLRNAKYLARYLVLKPNTQVSIMAFQEKEVNVCVPFTRNYDIMEEGINKIVATGLTPLALALDKGICHINKKNLKNPLIMLITDGIPTVSLWTSDPINDAVSAADKIAKNKINFCCIGLQPNKDCLIKITDAARGKLYILDELNREGLVEVAKKSSQW